MLGNPLDNAQFLINNHPYKPRLTYIPIPRWEGKGMVMVMAAVTVSKPSTNVIVLGKDTSGRVTIAGHLNDDLALGTLNSILKQAKLKEV